MAFALISIFAAGGLLLGMLIFSELGRRIGVARLAHDAEGLAKGTGAAEAAVFGLLGLLIAFTFSGAASRFEERRHLIAQETNAIGTAYLRIDLLPPAAQPEIRALFGRYLDNRLATYRDSVDQADLDARLAEGAALQLGIWSNALDASLKAEAAPQATMLLLPALNEMIDITTTRVAATQNNPPIVVFMLLAGLGLTGAMLVGYASSPNKHRSWFHVIVFAGILSLTVYVIADLEFPRLGLIQVDAADQILIELRESIG
jgi:hypothetical protein